MNEERFMELKNDRKAEQAFYIYAKICRLREHFKTHKNDNHSLIGLVKLTKLFARRVRFIISTDKDKYEFLQKYI